MDERDAQLDALVETVELLTIALGAAHVELDALTEYEVPLPDAVVKGLREREAMAETLKWLLDRSGVSVELAAAACKHYREALGKAHCSADGGPVPVDVGVLAELAGIEELLRRRRLTDRRLDDALRDLVLRSDHAGC